MLFRHLSTADSVINLKLLFPRQRRLEDNYIYARSKIVEFPSILPTKRKVADSIVSADKCIPICNVISTVNYERHLIGKKTLKIY